MRLLKLLLEGRCVRVKILFCNIAWMLYYKGLIPGEVEPSSGGEYVRKTGDAHEKFNFLPVDLTFADKSLPDGRYCLGFVETKATGKEKANQLHIERIAGCSACGSEPAVDDVLVVYCATHPAHSFTTVVGWYRNATVFREYQAAEFEDGIQNYNAIAKAEDCVLLPAPVRSRRTLWNIPRRNCGAAFGFGRSNVWFATGDEGNEELLSKFLKELEKNILGYHGENWLDKHPDGQ